MAVCQAQPGPPIPPVGANAFIDLEAMARFENNKQLADKGLQSEAEYSRGLAFNL